MQTEPILDLKSGYVRRAVDRLPRQGTRAPWRLHQNYLKDLLLLRFGRVVEDELEFARAPVERVASRRDPLPASTNP
jgi:hypothetical protein